MKNHTDLLNYIAAKIGAKTYLEIGVQNPNNNFALIKVPIKTGVDPEVKGHARIIQLTSDEFFQCRGSILYDLVFIDGLHHEDQVIRDTENSWKILNVGGVIMIHDCNPDREGITHVPRDSKEWTGNVYRATSRISAPLKFTVGFDYGCCIIRKTYQGDELKFGQDWQYPWNIFDQNRQEWLNLKTVPESLAIIDSWT